MKTIHFQAGGSGSVLVAYNQPTAFQYCQFTEGPVRPRREGQSWTDWYIERAEELSARGNQAEECLERASLLVAAIESVTEFDRIRVWYSDILGEHLFAVWMICVLEELGVTDCVRLSYLHMDRPDLPYQSLGGWSPSDLESASTRELTAGDVDVARRAWNSFVSTDPRLLEEFLDDLPDEDFVQALVALPERYPSKDDGLTGWERQLLSMMAERRRSTVRVIGRLIGLQYGNCPDFIGDQTLFERMCELANSIWAQPMLEQWGDGQSMRSTHFDLTPEARLVLNGEASRLEFVGIDRWIGGVHLSSASGESWCRNEDGFELVDVSIPLMVQSERGDVHGTASKRVHLCGRSLLVPVTFPNEASFAIHVTSGPETQLVATVESGNPEELEPLDATDSLLANLPEASQVVAWVNHAEVVSRYYPSWLSVGALADLLGPSRQGDLPVVQYSSSMHPADLAEMPIEPTPELVRECLKLWLAFRSADPTHYNDLMNELSFEGPRHECRNLIDMFPQASTGLSGDQTRAVSWVATGQRPENYVHTYRAAQSLADLIIDLPLLSHTPVYTGSPTEIYALTPAGLDVFEGRANHVDLNGIDRWVGGAHLNSKHGQVWWRRDGRIVETSR